MPDLLSLLPEDHRVALLKQGRRQRFPRRDTLMHEGDPAAAAHLILSGHLGIRRTTRRGEEATIAVHGPGELVGEMALIEVTARERSATVIALEDAETLIIERRHFDRLRAEVPAVGEWMLQVLASRLRESSAQLLDALYQTAEVRIYRRLLGVMEAFESGDVAITQDDLAAMAGTTRSTVNRALQAAQTDGLIVLTRGRVSVVDPAALRVRAELQ